MKWFFFQDLIKVKITYLLSYKLITMKMTLVYSHDFAHTHNPYFLLEIIIFNNNTFRHAWCGLLRAGPVHGHPEGDEDGHPDEHAVPHPVHDDGHGRGRDAVHLLHQHVLS